MRFRRRLHRLEDVTQPAETKGQAAAAQSMRQLHHGRMLATGSRIPQCNKLFRNHLQKLVVDLETFRIREV